MAKDFLSEIDKSYIVPTQIMVGNGSDPIDVRQTCDTVEDFEEIAEMGMELRYDGLITYEMQTGLWKGCKKIGDTFEWVTINGGAGGPENIDLSKYATKDHTHEDYLPEISVDAPVKPRPVGHVWLDI